MSVPAERNRPTGTVAFLFSDIVGSTRRWASEEAAMAEAVEQHDRIFHNAVSEHDGYVFATGGDSFAIAFSTSDQAISMALAVQRRLADEAWSTSEPIRVRIGINLGAANERAGDYFGPPVNVAARVESVAHAGQIVVTEPVARTCSHPCVELGSHDLKDISEPQSLWQVGDEKFPPLRTLERVRHSIPTLRTETFGREALVRDLRRLLASHRLVSLTGVGGAGKTRAAIETATAAAHDFDHGTYFADLVEVDSADSVWPAIQRALGLVGDVDVESRVLEFLSERRVLLVLDNCEQIIDEAAEAVDRLLEEAPAAVLLATSREALDVDGERVVRLAALDASAASRLFIDRAEAFIGDVLDHEDLTAIAHVCEQLDGVPLAIELAAACCSTMSPAEIARRLDERFTLLGSGRGRRRRRQQTLANVMDWSHDLLNEDERAMFRCLAVFTGVFEAEDVVAVSGFDPSEADRLMASLVAKSLVDVVRHRSGSGFRLLESARLYALDRLVESGQLEACREAHAAQFGLSSLGPTVRDVVPARADAERALRRSANVDAAIAYLASTGRRSEAAAVVATNWFPLLSTGRLADFRDLFLESHDEAPHEIQLALLSCAGGWMVAGDFEVVEAILTTAETAEELLVIPPSHQIRSARMYATLFTSGAEDALALVGDPADFHADDRWLVGYSDVFLVISICRYVLGDLDGAIDAARSSVDESVETPPGLVGGASAAWLLAEAGRHTEAHGVAAQLPPPSPGGWSHVQPLTQIVADLGRIPDEDVAGRVIDLVCTLDPGVVGFAGGDLLAPFIELRLRRGDRERAIELIDDVLVNQMLLPYLAVIRHAAVWPDDEWEAHFLEWFAATRGSGETTRRRRATSARLQEEIDFWERKLEAQAEIGVPE